MKTIRRIMAVAFLLMLCLSFASAFTIDKTEYTTDEGVVITLAMDELDGELSIETPSSTFKYLGGLEPSVTFRPMEPGTHAVVLNTQRLEFIVIEQLLSPVPSNQSLVAFPLSLTTKGLQGQSEVFQTRTIPGSEKVLEVRPEKAGVKIIRFRNWRSGDSFDFDEVTLKRAEVKKFSGKRIENSFFIDTSGLDFDNGEITRTARGSELWKCKLWNASTETCYGVWELVQALAPGQQYSIDIFPGDPAYVETGVATINSVKPIYEPGETAELLMAVLDTSGSLVTGANINLTITKPNNVTALRTTGQDTITEISTGIYKAFFSDTSLEGTYELFVDAQSTDVSVIMASSFDVALNYNYDILRNAPMSIDPWLGSFESSITVEQHNMAGGSVTVTEQLPLSFIVTNAGGGSVTSTNTTQLLTWTSVAPGTTLTYLTQAPLVTPDMYSLGAATIAHVTGTQVEARPWFLAIDPTNTLNPILNANTAVAGVALTSTEVGYISSDNLEYVTFTKNEVLTVEIGDPTNSSPISSVSSLSCAVTYTGQSYSPAATFRVDDSAGANVLGTTTLPAPSPGSDSTVTLSNLQNDADFQIADLFTLNIYIRNNDGGGPQTISVDRVWCTVSYAEADIADPTISLNSPDEGDFFDTSSITFNFTPSDNVGLDDCHLYIDNIFNKTLETPVNGSPNTISSNIGEGPHNWTIACNDTSNNLGWATETRNFTVDLSDPGAFTLSAPENDTVSVDLTPTFTWTATTETNFKNYTLLLDDNPAFPSPNYVRYTLNSVANTTYTFPTVISSNTLWYWKVVAYDYAGRLTESSVQWIYITDTVLPTAFNLVSPATSTISQDRTPSLDWSNTVETNFKNYTIQFDDNIGFTSVDYTYATYNTVTNSSYQVQGGEELAADMIWYWRVIAYDRAGQSRTSTSTWTYTTDNSGPGITLEAPSPGHSETVSNTILFNYSVTDTMSNVASCELIINGTVEQTQPSITEGVTLTFSQYLDNGAYEWWVNCTDDAGNENESLHRFLTVDVTTDTTPPLVTLNYPGHDDYIDASTIIFNYSVQDATGVENCSLYINGTWNMTNTSVVNNADNYFTVSNFDDEKYSWYVLCYDNATPSNFGVSDTNNFTVDTTPPGVFTLLVPPNQTKSNNPVQTLNWTQTTETNFANYTILLDNNANFASPEYIYTNTLLTDTDVTTGSLADDYYYWKVIAYDSAGNSRDSTVTWEFEIHTELPELSNIAESPLDPVEYNPYRIYNFTVDIDEPELDTVFFQHDFYGSLENYTPTGTNGITYYFEILGLNVSDYTYSWWANDTFGNENQTIEYSYVVTKNTTAMTLYIDQVAGNAVVNESEIINLTGLLNWPSVGVVTIRKNGTLLVQNPHTVTSMHNFTTPSLYLINASYPGSSNYKASWQAWNVTVQDIFAPKVTLFEPQNDTSDLDGAVSYSYKVTDTNDVVNCTLYIDGVPNGTTPDPDKDTVLYFNRDYDVNQNLTWQVRCIDSADHVGNSGVYNLTIDIREYTLGLVPYNCIDSGTCTASNINISGGAVEDHGSLVKQSNNFVYANITPAGIPLGATILNVSIEWDKYQGTSNGVFYLSWLNGSNWVPICSQAFTSSTSASRDDVSCDFSTFPELSVFNDGIDIRANFYYGGNPGIPYGTDFVRVNVSYQEDVSPPSVQLNDPYNGQERGAGPVVFNFTPADTNLYNCSLWGDFNGPWERNQTLNLSQGLTSDIENSFSAITLTPGFYNWNVECYDIAGNSASAFENYTVNVTPPDLVVYSQYITFNISNPREDENLTINATIFNEGLTEALDFKVQFWHGDPDVGGSQIGSNITISSLSGLSNMTIGLTYIARVGPNPIYVIVDPDDLVTESYEDNNEANKSFHVDAYHTYHGGFSANITLDTANNDTIVAYYGINATSNLFFVRTGTNLDFTALRPLGKTTADLNTSDDFSEADSLLNMTGFQDSLNQRWAGGTNRPLVTTVLNIYKTAIDDIPVINSDGSGNFTTGILWDASYDDSSNTEYDTVDKEPIVFITQVSQDSGSQYGIDDYVAEIPALLRSYAAQPENTITIYYELV